MKILSAKIQSENEIVLLFNETPYNMHPSDFQIDGVSVNGIKQNDRSISLYTSNLNVKKNYRIRVGKEEKTLQQDGILNQLFSDKSLGAHSDSDHTIFRLFAPRASSVTLILYAKYDQKSGDEYDLVSDKNGVWETIIKGNHGGKYYGYRINGPKDPTELFNPSTVIADPYTRSVVTSNHYLHSAKGLILKSDHFNWEDDQWISMKMEDLIIYEMHVRDMTAHVSSGVSHEKRGRYLGLIEKGIKGGLNYLKSIGINAVELLPVHEFANIEIDYKNRNLSTYNDWNPYARNHWGYMTSNFFSPESYYATDGTLKRDQFCGIHGRGVTEFKQMVKRFHQEKIAVILDVVYNHVSHYDLNSFKLIDKKYYFRLDGNQDFQSKSHCGNDFNNERPMVKRLIIESLLYWMTEYHIDGFRFDLAGMIDESTLDMITEETRKINPDVILIAEPWGGDRYGQEPFSKRGWGSWNDRFRNGIKGEDPRDRKGFIFGQWGSGESKETIRQYVSGSIHQYGGPYNLASHSVNYLACHDGYTLGDFIRIGLDHTLLERSVQDIQQHIRLTDSELQIHKLAALILMTSQGAVMIHEGQEFARSKVIAETKVPDVPFGTIDYNSYNKDDETNWINYEHTEINKELHNYYRGLIALRKRYSVFRRSNPESIQFIECPFEFCAAFLMVSGDLEEPEEFLIVFNSDPKQSVHFQLPDGKWDLLVNHETAGCQSIHNGLTESISIHPISGIVLRKII